MKKKLDWLLIMEDEATSIRVFPATHSHRLPSAGSFAALKTVNIAYTLMEGCDMDDVLFQLVALSADSGAIPLAG